MSYFLSKIMHITHLQFLLAYNLLLPSDYPISYFAFKWQNMYIIQCDRILYFITYWKRYNLGAQQNSYNFDRNIFQKFLKNIENKISILIPHIFANTNNNIFDLCPFYLVLRTVRNTVRFCFFCVPSFLFSVVKYHTFNTTNINVFCSLCFCVFVYKMNFFRATKLQDS